MVGLLIYLLVLCIVVALAYYIINSLLPEPIRKVATVILVVLATIVLIMLLLQLSSSDFHIHALR
jgi:asparagine N-glycosylation enzyme membrane subunit Stt3